MRVINLETKFWTVDKVVNNTVSYPQLEEAARLLAKNEVVAFPTETVYGLGANAKNEAAVKKIYEAKGRPSDNPLIVHVASEAQILDIVDDISPLAKKLMNAFWPGPLTLIFKRKEGAIAQTVTAGLSTVAVRMPNHPVALKLIELSGVPIAAPSANTSGKPSPTSASHVKHDLNGRIAGIVDGGVTGVGLESTVVDCTQDIPIILRPGGVTKEQLEEVLGAGTVMEDIALTKKEETPRAPGMKYTHYAPKAPLILVSGSPEFIQTLVNERKSQGQQVGILAPEEHRSLYDVEYFQSPGSLQELAGVANGLYKVLRTFDELPVDVIFCETFPDKGIGRAIMNRLEKAAGYQVIVEK